MADIRTKLEQSEKADELRSVELIRWLLQQRAAICPHQLPGEYARSAMNSPKIPYGRHAGLPLNDPAIPLLYLIIFWHHTEDEKLRTALDAEIRTRQAGAGGGA